MLAQQAFGWKGSPPPPGQAGEIRAEGGGEAILAPAALHEFYVDRTADAAALSGCMLSFGVLFAKERSLLWVRQATFDQEAGQPYPPGLREWGLDPARLMLLRARDVTAALQGALEGARCPGLGAVFLELWGEAPAYDLTASRRLALAARASGVSLLVSRIGAKARPSAAETRWAMRALPSRALAAQAPGFPAFKLTLLRARHGREGLNDHLEWNRDVRQFLSRSPGEDRPAERTPSSLPGLVVPVSFDRSRAAEPWREAG